MGKPATSTQRKSLRVSAKRSTDSKMCIAHDENTKGQDLSLLIDQGLLKIKEAAKVHMQELLNRIQNTGLKVYHEIFQKY